MNKNIIIFPIVLAALALASFACWWSPRPDLLFAPDKLPDAQVGSSYEVEIQITQNVTPVFIMGALDGALPDGLKLEYTEHDNFAKITGIPQKAGTYKFKVYADCLGTNVSGQTGEMEYTIVVK
jgi:hypothetical protein